MRTLLALLLMVAPCLSQGVDAPTEAKVGEYVIVKADVAPEVSVLWQIFDPWELRYDTFESNTVLVFSAGLSPRTIRGQATIIDFEARTAVQERFQVTVTGDVPPPPPPPPPPIDNPFGLREVARDAVAKVPVSYQKFAPALAKEMRDALATAQADTAQDLVNAVRTAQKKALGGAYNTWEDWAHEVNKILETNETKLQDIKVLRSAYLAICSGLESYKHVANKTSVSAVESPSDPGQRSGIPGPFASAPVQPNRTQCRT